MPKSTGDKNSLAEEEIQKRLSQVMDNWQSYPDFANLFDALLTANRDMLSTELGQRYSAAIGSEETSSALVETIQDVRSGRRHPTYRLIEDLLRYNLLGLDPKRIQLGSPDRPTGDHRIALFAAAGLIEITPESIRQWNREVLAGWRTWRTRNQNKPAPTWKDLMQKLMEFHTQGNRLSWRDLGARARQMADDATLLPSSRLNSILTSRNVPSQQERISLAHTVGLEPDQVAFIEEAIENGSLSLQKHAEKTQFASQLDNISEMLKANGISLVQLAQRTGNPLTGQSGVAHQVLSSWRLGRVRPSLGNIRALVFGLRSCKDQVGNRLITEEEIGSLTDAAGFASHELTDTAHDVIARISETTRIKPLLSAIRNAVDVCVSTSAIPCGPPDGTRLATGMVNNWESEKCPHYPTASQVRALLQRYNSAIQQAGHSVLSDQEIEQVVVVAEHDRSRWLALPQSEKRGGHSARHRPPLSPSLDDGPAYSGK